MARSHGKVLVGIWIDPDWNELGPLEQWAYMMLLSQPRLSLVGCVDYQPARWALHAAGLTGDLVEAAVASLEAAGYVCVDHDTEELLVRSMTRHDGLRSNNPKLLKGLWSHWSGIASRGLRKVAVDNMPDALFDCDFVPKGVEDLRRSPQMDWAIGRAIEPPSSIHLPPSAIHRHPIRRPIEPAAEHIQDGPTPEVEAGVDYTHHAPAQVEPEQREANLTQLDATRRRLHPVPDDAA